MTKFRTMLTAAAVVAITATTAAAQTKWNLPAAYPATNYNTENLASFAEEVKQATCGKLEITVHGDRGTLHFECHFVDPKTGEIVAATPAVMDVARIGGEWLITHMVGGTTDLEV
jgi:hypothetical protein